MAPAATDQKQVSAAVTSPMGSQAARDRCRSRELVSAKRDCCHVRSSRRSCDMVCSAVACMLAVLSRAAVNSTWPATFSAVYVNDEWRRESENEVHINTGHPCVFLLAGWDSCSKMCSQSTSTQ